MWLLQRKRKCLSEHDHKSETDIPTILLAKFILLNEIQGFLTITSHFVAFEGPFIITKN